MRTVEKLLIEFDLKMCEDLPAPMRQALHGAFLTGVGGGAIMTTEVFVSCWDKETDVLDRELFARSMNLIVHELQERARAMQLPTTT